MSATTPSDEIMACISGVVNCLNDGFILIGGASMSVMGSHRKTSDIDIVVPPDAIQGVYHALIDRGLLTAVDGQYRFRNTKTLITLDVLSSVVDCLSFESLLPHVFHIGGVPLPNLDYALAIKIKCFYLRADDENGNDKQASDIMDVKFICEMMVKSGQGIGDNCAQSFRFGYYHILALRFELGYQDIESFIRIGGRKLILPWDENPSDQQEYYTCYAEPGSDPLTVTLTEELLDSQLTDTGNFQD